MTERDIYDEVARVNKVLNTPSTFSVGVLLLKEMRQIQESLMNREPGEVAAVAEVDTSDIYSAIERNLQHIQAVDGDLGELEQRTVKQMEVVIETRNEVNKLVSRTHRRAYLLYAAVVAAAILGIIF